MHDYVYSRVVEVAAGPRVFTTDLMNRIDKASIRYQRFSLGLFSLGDSSIDLYLFS